MSASKPKKGSFNYIAAKIRADAEFTEFGFDFERLCIFFLRNDPKYAGLFENVYLFDDWPHAWAKNTGIDIVAETSNGQVWAIQAKDYESRPPDTKDLTHFLKDSQRKHFTHRLLITTNEAIGENAAEFIRATGLEAQDKPISYITRESLETSPIRWPATIGGTSKNNTPKPLPKKRHQTRAVNAVIKGFNTSNRGRLIMACGSGKTNTALLITEKLEARHVLVLVPSLGLVNQFISEWCRHRAVAFDYLLVCSDQTVNPENPDPAIQRVADLGVPVTTNVKDIRRFLGDRSKRKKVIVSTYHSVEQISHAQRSRKLNPFDIVICDEAHRTAAATESYYSLALDETRIKSRRRLFMTATPKYISGFIKRKAEEQGLAIVSMDDEKVYGPEFFRFTFSDAIRIGELADYRLVVVGVTDKRVRSLIDKANIVRAGKLAKTDTYSLAKTLGLIKTINQYRLRKLITFHDRIAKAKTFSDPTKETSISAVNDLLPKSSRIVQPIWSGHVNGEMTAGGRETILRRLEQSNTKTLALVSNVACLGEGINVPDLDSIAFIDPKSSEIDIIQAVGRAIRKPRMSKKTSTIFVPVVVNATDSDDEVLKSKGFQSVLKIIWALRSHDDDIGEVLDRCRIAIKKNPKTAKIVLPRNIVLDLPRRINIKSFERAVCARIVKSAGLLPIFSETLVLKWSDSFAERNKGLYPHAKLGRVKECPDATWSEVDNSFIFGTRGLPKYGSLFAFLLKHRRRELGITVDDPKKRRYISAKELFRRYGFAIKPLIQSGSLASKGKGLVEVSDLSDRLMILDVYDPKEIPAAFKRDGVTIFFKNEVPRSWHKLNFRFKNKRDYLTKEQVENLFQNVTLHLEKQGEIRRAGTGLLQLREGPQKGYLKRHIFFHRAGVHKLAKTRRPLKSFTEIKLARDERASLDDYALDEYLVERMVRNFIVGIGKYREKKFIAPDIVFSRGEANGYLYKKSSLDQFLKKVGVTSLDVGGLMTSKQLAVAFGRDHNTTGRYLKKYKKELPTPETSFGKVAGKGIGITNYYPKETVSKLTALLRRDEIEIKNRKPITVNKVRYRSIQKACEILGLNYAVVGKRLREGASTRKAFKEAYQK